MPVTADKVIVELEARMARYERDVASAQQKFDRAMADMRKSSSGLEQQIQRDQGKIGGYFKSMAASIAAAFTVREIVNMGDTWSDLSSQVGVAVRDMEAAPELMNRIAEAARASYSPLEQTATQFARNARTMSQMGYSTDQTMLYTEALNNALVATATRGDRARSVVDAMSKAIATGKLEAEGLQTILTHGGAVAEVLANELGVTTNELYRMRKEGQITGDVLVRSLIKNFDDLRAQAESMPATGGDAFTLLRNELIRFVGETDKALGASERLAKALILLSDNIDRIAPALAIIATLFAGRFVAGAVASSAALRAVAAHAAIATTSMAGLSLAAGSAGSALLTALGGPVGVALALGAGLLYLASQAESTSEQLSRLEGTADDAAKRADELEARLRAAGIGIEGTGSAADGASAKMGAYSSSVQTATQRLQQLARQAEMTQLAMIGQKRLELTQERAEVENRQVRRERSIRSQTRTGDVYAVNNAKARDITDRTVSAIDRELANLERQSKAIRTAMENNVNILDEQLPVAAAVVEAAKPAKAKAERAARTGPTQDEIALRFARDEEGLQAEIIRETSNLLGTRKARFEAELELIEMNRATAEREIRASKEYSEAQRAALVEMNNRAATLARQATIADMVNERQQEAFEAQQSSIDSQLDLARIDADLATTMSERREVELRILALQQEQERLKLRAVLADRTITDATRAEAEARLRVLNDLYQGRERVVRQGTQGPLEAAADRADRSPEEIRERAEELIVEEVDNVREGMRNALTRAIGVKDPIIAGLLDMMLDKLIFQPLLDSMSKATSGGRGLGGLGGLLGGAVGSLFGLPGRASGGAVEAGKLYRVNERMGGAELFQPAGSGRVIPLSAQASMGRAGGGEAAPAVVQVRVVGGQLFAAHVERISGRVAVETVTVTAPEIISRSADEAMGRLGRTKI